MHLRSHEEDSAVSWGGRQGGAMGQSNQCEKLLGPLVTTAPYPWKQLEPALNTGRQEAPTLVGAQPPPARSSAPRERRQEAAD